MKLFPDNFVQNADKAINAIDGFLKKYQELGKTSTNLDTANADLKKYKANLEEAETKLKSFGDITTTKQAWKEQARQVESYKQSLDAVIKKSAEVNASKKTPKTTSNEDYNNLTKLIQLQNEYNRVVKEGGDLRGTTGAKTNAVKNAVSKYLETENISIQKLQRSYAGLRSAETSHIQQMATTDTNSKEWEKLKVSLDVIRAKMLANKLVMNQLKKEAVSQELTQSFGLTKFTDTSFSKAAQQFISSTRIQLQQLRAEGQNLDILNPQDLAEFDKLIQKIDEATTRAHDFEDALQKKNEASSMVDEKTKEVEKLQKAFDNFDSKGKIDKLFSDLEKLGISTDGIEKSAEGVQQLKEHLLGVNSDGVKKLNDEFGKTKTQVQASEDAINKIRNSLGDLGQATTSLQQMNSEFEQLKSQAQYFFGLTNSFNLLKRAIRGAYETVKKLDAAMTETAVVTDFSVGDMWEQLPQYTTMAKKLGATTEGAYRTAALYYQQGLDTAEAMQLSTETMKMARVAGMEYASATKAMTSALRGFNMELSDMSAQRVNDVYSELAKITATDTQQLATAMTKTASIAYSANMEFENVSAFLAQILETTQEAPETAGTALKTIIGRFTEVKKLYSSNQLIGKDSEGEEIQVNKVSQALSAAGINLNEFFTGAKGLDDILYELSQRWDTLDVTVQRYIATQAAGSRQQSRFIALMQNNARLTELMNAAKNSKGSAEGQFEKTLDSLEAKVNKLRDAWEEFLMGIANSDLIKGSIDLLTKLLEVINKLTKGTGGLDSALMKLAVVGTALQLGGGLLQGGLGYFNARRYAVQAKGMAKAGVDPNTIKTVSNGFTGNEDIGSFMSYLGGGLANFGNLGFVGMAKDMIKGLFTGIKGLFTNVLDAEKTGEIGNAILKANQGFLTNDALSATARTQAYANAMKTTSASGKFSQLWAGLTTGVNTKSQLKQSVAEYAKITGIKLTDAATGAQAYEQAITRMNAANGGATTGLAKFGAVLGANLPLVLGITAAVGALVAIGVATYFNSAAYKLKKLNKEIENLNEQIEKTNQEIEDFKEWKKTQSGLENQLATLTRGTLEFNQALIEANNNVLSLLQKHLGLKLSTELGEYGQLQIDKTSLKDFEDTQKRSQMTLTALTLKKTLERDLFQAEQSLKSAEGNRISYLTNEKAKTSKGTTSVTRYQSIDPLYKAWEQSAEKATTDFTSWVSKAFTAKSMDSADARYQLFNDKQYFGGTDYIQNDRYSSLLIEINNYLSAILGVETAQQALATSMNQQYLSDQNYSNLVIKRNEDDKFGLSSDEKRELGVKVLDFMQLDKDTQNEIKGNYLNNILEKTNLFTNDTNTARDILDENAQLSENEVKAIYKQLYGTDILPERYYDEKGEFSAKETAGDDILLEIDKRVAQRLAEASLNIISQKGFNSLQSRILQGNLTQADIDSLGDNQTYDNAGFTETDLEALNISADNFNKQIEKAVKGSEEALKTATIKFNELFGENFPNELKNLDAEAAKEISQFLTDFKLYTGEEFGKEYQALLSGVDVKERVNVLQALSRAEKGNVNSIKLQINALVKSGKINQETANKIIDSWSNLSNAIKQIDFETAINQLQAGQRFVRDIEEGTQDRTFKSDEYNALMELLPSEWADKFTQDLDGNMVYLGASMDDLKIAIQENTSALLNESREQLENARTAGQYFQNEMFSKGSNKREATISFDSIQELLSGNDYTAKVEAIKEIQSYITPDIAKNLANSGFDINQLYLDQNTNLNDPQVQQQINDSLSNWVDLINKTTSGYYDSAINRISQQQGSFQVQAQAPMTTLGQTKEAINNKDATLLESQIQGIIALGQTAGANSETIEKLASFYDNFENFNIDDPTSVKNLSNAITEALEDIDRAQQKSRLEALKGDVNDLKDTLSDANFSAQAAKVADGLSNILGVEVDSSFVTDYLDLVRKAVAGGDEAIEALRELRLKALALNDIELDPLELKAVLDSSDAESEAYNLAVWLNNLVGGDYMLEVNGTSDMSGILGAIGSVIMQLALMKAAAAESSDEATEIMTNAEELMQQIADSLGFEMETTTETKPIYGSFTNYKQVAEGETPNQTVSWKPVGTNEVQVGEEVQWSFKKKDDNGGSSSSSGKSGGSGTSGLGGWSGIKDLLSNSGLFKFGNEGGGFKNPVKNHVDPSKYVDKPENKTTGGGGGGSGDKGDMGGNQEDKWENSYDWLYNLTQDINAELEKREKLELKYNNILKDRNKTAKELYQNAKAQLDSLEKSRNLNAEAYEKRKAELQFEAKQATAQYTNDTRFNMKWGTGLSSGKGSSSGLHVIDLAGSGGGGSEDTKKDQGKRTMLSEAELGRYATFNWDDNTVEINWDAVNQITDQQKGEAVEDYISKLEEIQEKMNEAEKSLLEIDGKIREIIEQGKDEFKDFEQQIFDALVSRYQKEIDKLTEISEAITDANSKLIDSMTNAIDKEREARNNEKTETELADKQKQLDYLRSDTSNANAKQILDLQKELTEGQEDYTDQLIDQKIDELKEQNDKASEQRQVQIDLMTKNLEMAQETGALWQEVYNLMDVGVDQEGALVKQSELFDLLQSEAGWQGMSAVSKMTWLDELTETVKAGMAYLMTGRQLEYIGTEAGKQITFSAYDEQGKLQWLTGTVDKNGDVVDSNGVRYSEIFQNYDGSFTTMETAGVGTKKEPPKPETKPSAPSSSGGTGHDSGSTNWDNAIHIDATGKKGSGSGTKKKQNSVPQPTNKNKKEIITDVGPNRNQQNIVVSQSTPKTKSKEQNPILGPNVQGFFSKNIGEFVFFPVPDLPAPPTNNFSSNPTGYTDEVLKLLTNWGAYPTTKYKTGGLNTQTGPAWLDGTFAKPELVLNSKDTANFLELRDLLRALQISIKSPHRDLTDNNKNNGDNYYEIDINVESIADDYDVAKMADKIKKLISQDALYRNGNAINRLR